MNRRSSSAALGTDLSNVIALLQERRIVPAKPSNDLLDQAKAIHNATYSLILWRFRLQGLPLHGRVFLEEIASDALQILPQVLLGFSKTAKLLIRGIAENALRHIYFSDHPIEFMRMNRDIKWYVTIESLNDYAKNHPQYLKTEAKFDAIARLASLYSDLSAGVHGRSVRDLEMRRALGKIAFDIDAAKTDAELVRKCAASVNFLLAIFHHERVRRFQVADRSLILRTMPPTARSVWASHDSAS
ncbi:hypothetical protein [Mesorhizobium sp. M0140]|uniref:hypothetical protein n=1 Tax=Mesorhizobium sp. M0140 TaxID=2956893 RepID=UPI00333BE6D1